MSSKKTFLSITECIFFNHCTNIISWYDDTDVVCGAVLDLNFNWINYFWCTLTSWHWMQISQPDIYLLSSYCFPDVNVQNWNIFIYQFIYCIFISRQYNEMLSLPCPFIRKAVWLYALLNTLGVWSHQTVWKLNTPLLLEAEYRQITYCHLCWTSYAAGYSRHC